MDKYFNKQILDELEDCFDRWIMKPPSQFTTAPDGGCYFVFVANRPEDKGDDSVYKDAVRRIINEPFKQRKTRRRQASCAGDASAEDEPIQSAAMSSPSTASRFIHPFDSNFLISRSEFFSICAETCTTTEFSTRSNLVASLLNQWHIFSDLIMNILDRFDDYNAAILRAALADYIKRLINRLSNLVNRQRDRSVSD